MFKTPYSRSHGSHKATSYLWASAEFKLYLIKEFQRLKVEESQAKSLEWNLTRSLSKTNYRINTDDIVENIIPKTISKVQVGLIYASEADVLKMALFGINAKQWREQNNTKQGNMRDHANVE